VAAKSIGGSIRRRLAQNRYPATGFSSICGENMNSSKSMDIFRNYIQKAGMYFPLLYYGGLLFYCFSLLFIGSENIPALAISPLIYSLIIPILLFISLPLLYLIAYNIYKDQVLKKRILEVGILAAIIGFIALVYVIVIRKEMPDQFQFLLSVREFYTFEASDIVFITLSLIEVALVTSFSIKSGLSEIEFVDSWFHQISMIGIYEIFLVMVSVVFALPITVFAEFNEIKAIYLFLSFIYGITVGLRILMMKRTTTLFDLVYKNVSYRKK